ncbi:MAG: SNF2-related protein [Chloroflexales bacterium]
MALPITRKILLDWAGQPVFRDATTLFERGLVREALWTPPRITGTILWSNRPLKTGLRIMNDRTVENLCPCRDSRERGIICSHAVAVCLQLLKAHDDPARERMRVEEQAHATATVTRIRDAAYIRRVKPGEPGAVRATVRLTLGDGWREAARTGQRVALLATAVWGESELPLDLVPRDVPLAFGPTDEAALFVLEDIVAGPATGRVEVSLDDLVNLIEIFRGRTIGDAERHATLTIATTPLASILKLDLNPENGELLLRIHTERPLEPESDASAAPLYLIAAKAGWIVGHDYLWPLEALLPGPVRQVYQGSIHIARPSVPGFMQTELPFLSRFLRVASDLSSDLFTIEPAMPRFKMRVRGSPASLAATLFAQYNGYTLVANKPDPVSHFAIPDEHDLMRYTVRNLPAEQAALALLVRHGFKGGERGDKLEAIIGTREVLNFIGSQMPALRRFGWHVELEGRVAGFAEDADYATPVVRINAPAGQDWFEVGFDFENRAGASLSSIDIQRALRKDESFLGTPGKSPTLLDAQAINALMDVFRDCGGEAGERPGTFRMPMIYAAYVQTSLNALDGVDIESPPDWRVAAEQMTRLREPETIDMPDGLENVLRPYQKDGVRWLRFIEGNGFAGILADEMGLGKTVQALAWLRLERVNAMARGRPTLIVCPTSLVDNWAEEAQRFLPGMKVLAISGSERHMLWRDMPQADLVITSYALLRRDIERHLQHEYAVVVLDEAQHIKNRSTQNAVTVKQIHAKHRLVLTGTPLENSVSDLWSIMDFLMPGYLGSHENFRRNYELPIAGGDMDGEAAQLKLRRKLQPFLLRRLKADVARDLPPRIERIAQCTLSSDQKAVYAELLASARQKITDLVAKQGLERSRMEVLKTLLRLRQVCCHLDLLHLPNLKAAHPSAKMELFFELLDEAVDGGHRVLVFSQFVTMLQILRQELERRHLTYCYLDGSTKERQKVVHEFNGNRSIPVFLISLKAGGTGLNLTGADMVVHFDPWWNPAVEDQATDRAHRIGQKRTVYSVKLITRGTVEEKVLALQQRKKSLIQAMLSQDGAIVNHLSMEEILELLAL